MFCIVGDRWCRVAYEGRGSRRRRTWRFDCVGSFEEKGKPEYARKKCLVAMKLENQQETQPAFGLPRRCRKWNPCHIILVKGEY